MYQLDKFKFQHEDAFKMCRNWGKSMKRGKG